MDFKKIERLNQAKLPKKYRQLAEAIPDNDWIDIDRSWKTGNTKLYNDILDKYHPCGKDKGYHLLAIWFHPLTKFQQLAVKVDNLVKSF